MTVNEPVYENMIQERDVMVRMRDGVHLAVDVYWPKAEGTYPVLYTCAVHNKDLQRPELVEALPPHVCSSKTVAHSVYHNAEYPSHLLLPVIPPA